MSGNRQNMQSYILTYTKLSGREPSTELWILRTGNFTTSASAVPPQQGEGKWAFDLEGHFDKELQGLGFSPGRKPTFQKRQQCLNTGNKSAGLLKGCTVPAVRA